MDLVSLLSQRLSPYRGSLSLPFLVGVSGGIDSMVLVACLEEAQIPCILAYMDHGIRDDAVSDVDVIQRMFPDLPLHIQHCDVPTYARKQGLSLEEAGRSKRYAWFAELRQQLGVAWVLTAHHRDDALESIFLHLMRGTGIHGLQGIRCEDTQRALLRPFWDVPKDTLRTYAREHGISWHEDTTNLSTDYTRNMIRQEVFPLLLERFPTFPQAWMRMGKTMEQIESYLLSQLRSMGLDPDSDAWQVPSIQVPDILGTTWLVALHQRFFLSYSQEKIQRLWEMLTTMRSGGMVELSDSHALRVFQHRWFLSYPSQERHPAMINTPREPGYLRAHTPKDTLVFYLGGVKKHKQLKKVWAEFGIPSHKRSSYQLFVSPQGEGLALIGDTCISYVGMEDQHTLTF